MGCFVRGGKSGMGCFVWGDKNCMGCFVLGGKLMRDVLSEVLKIGMGCFVQGCFVLHSSDSGNGNRSVSLTLIWLKFKVNQMLPSSYISSLLVSIL